MPRALIFGPHRRSMVSSMPTTTGPLGTISRDQQTEHVSKRAFSFDHRPAAAVEDAMKGGKGRRLTLRPITAQVPMATVRRPGLKDLAPATRMSRRLAKVGLRFHRPAKGAIQGGGRMLGAVGLVMTEPSDGVDGHPGIRDDARKDSRHVEPMKSPGGERIEALQPNDAFRNGPSARFTRQEARLLADQRTDRRPNRQTQANGRRLTRSSVLWWNGQRWAAFQAPCGIATMTLDPALDYIASDPMFWPTTHDQNGQSSS